MATVVYSRTFTPVVTAGIYSANDVVGGRMSFFAGNNGVLRSVIATDKASVGMACKLYIFDAQPTTLADNAAFAPTEADLKKLIATIAIAGADWVTLATRDHVQKAVEIPYRSPSSTLYAYLTCDATPTFLATDDLWFKLVMQRG